MDHQESLLNTEIPSGLINMEEIYTDNTNTEDPIDNIQSGDIYKVQPGRNKALKLIALNILKYLPEDILREEPDFSSIKSNNTIQDYGPCGECDIPILAEDPPRSLVLNVCGDMVHRTCAKKIYKDGTLLCSCGMADNSDPLLPFQYSIVDYGGREKSSISESDRPSLVNLRNLGYNILKSLEDKSVRDIDFPELGSCSECGNDILMSPLKAFSYLTCGHIFHRLCIEKKLFLGTPSACPAPDCGKNVDILDQADALGIVSNLPLPDPRETAQSSGISPLSKSMGETFALSSPPIRIGGMGTVTQQAKSILRCAKCSEDLSSCLPPLGFLRFSPRAPTKHLLYLTCTHIVHLDCVDNLRKPCPICPSTNDTETDDMETDDDDIVTNNLETQGSSTTQKKRTRKSTTEKSSSKKKKTTNKDDVSTMLKKLIEELLTNIPDTGEVLEETNASDASSNTGNFLYLSNMIEQAEKKNEDATRNVINRYFAFGEALYLRYKELKPSYGKDGAKALVEEEVRKQIPETKFSDEALRKRRGRSEKAYKLFNSIGKSKIERIRSFPARSILNLSDTNVDRVIAGVLRAERN